MRDVKIDSEQIGSVVSAENAHLRDINANVQANSDKLIMELLDKINTQALNLLNHQKLPKDQRTLAECVIKAIPEIKREENKEAKKSKISTLMSDINGIMGESIKLIGNVSSLLKLF